MAMVLFVLAFGLFAAHRAVSGGNLLETAQNAAEPAVERTERTPLVLASALPERTVPERAIHTDPYAGWSDWCEPLDYDTPCKTHEDCSKIQHVSRRALRCVHPHWAKDAPDYKVCAPGYSTRMERVWREARLRELVAQAYFDEAKECADWSWEPVRSKRGNVLRYDRAWSNGRPTHRQFWKCTQQQARAEKLTRVLNVIYGRETSKRPWKRHRLDVEPNKEAWIKEALAYGWKLDLVCINGRKKCRKSKMRVAQIYPDPSAKKHSPHYQDRWRWRYGLGGYGKNAAYGVQDWDLMAPPEVLCLEVPGTEAYLRDARQAVTTYTSSSPPVCNGVPYRGQALSTSDATPVLSPSWVDVHRVASGGKWCPRLTKDQKFRARVLKARLDPDEPVTLSMLGRPIPRDQQNQISRRILQRLELVLPPPWPQLPAADNG